MPRSSQSLGLNSLADPVQLPPLRETTHAPFDIKRRGLRAAGPGRRGLRAARHLHDPRPARRPGRPEPALAQRQPDPVGALLEPAAVPGPRRAPVGAARRPLPRQSVGRRLQPGQRAGGRRGRRRSGRSTAGSRRPSARSTPTTSSSSTATATRRSSTSWATRCRTASTPRTTTRFPGSSTAARTRGSAAGEYVDRDRVEETFLARTAYMRETGTPIWVGEFGPVYTGDPARDEQRYRLLEDQLEIYRPPRRELGAVDLQGHRPAGRRHASIPDSAYLRRIAPVLEKKARLGVDSWGSTDAGVRDILEPIERLFQRGVPRLPALPVGRAAVDPRPRPPRDARRGAGGRLRPGVRGRRARRGGGARRRVLVPPAAVSARTWRRYSGARRASRAATWHGPSE